MSASTRTLVLTAPQRDTLRALALFSPEFGASPSGVARARHIDPAAASIIARVLDTLVRHGLARSFAGPSVRPTTRYAITSRGQEYLDA